SCDQVLRPTVNGRSINLTGTWSANDGATYWIRQIGSCLSWAGFSGTPDTPTIGRSFANVFLGTVTTPTPTTAQIVGYWSDIPRGVTFNSGILTLSVKADAFGRFTIFTKVQTPTTGPFSATSWKRIG